MSGYSREYEDQADRVGLRYVYQAGFDPTKGPGLWGKFKEKYGELNYTAPSLDGSGRAYRLTALTARDAGSARRRPS
jgi:predicted Zn-dependent protease